GLGRSEARLGITEPRYSGPVHAAGSRCPALLDVIQCRPLDPLVTGLPSTPPEATVAPLNEISIQYTSGTTSKPKGVLLTHANYIYGGEGMSKAIPRRPTHRHP